MFELRNVEIDVDSPNEISDVCDFAHKYGAPAIVVDPDLVPAASVKKGTINSAKFKIITTVDWPKGEQQHQHKFRGLNTGAVVADGYEILLTTKENLSANERLKEIKFLNSFMEQFFPPTTETRFVIKLDKDEETGLKILESVAKAKLPELVRASIRTKVAKSKSTGEYYDEQIKKYSKKCQVKYKVSGNVDFDTISTCERAHRFGATFEQAKKIVENSIKYKEEAFRQEQEQKKKEEQQQDAEQEVVQTASDDGGDS